MSCVLHIFVTRWQNIQVALDAHRKRLDIALEIHAFNRDVDDINDRINEKVCLFVYVLVGTYYSMYLILFIIIIACNLVMNCYWLVYFFKLLNQSHRVPVIC